jgi:hypothetical protein
VEAGFLEALSAAELQALRKGLVKLLAREAAPSDA